MNHAERAKEFLEEYRDSHRCKDCVHHEVCEYDKALVEDTNLCEYFKPKSRFVELPCEVGQTVYYINTFYSKNPIIVKCEVDALHITSGKNQRGHKKPSYALIRNENMKSLSTRVYFENFGKTVFISREEAENALRERSK